MSYTCKENNKEYVNTKSVTKYMQVADDYEITSIPLTVERCMNCEHWICLESKVIE